MTCVFTHIDVVVTSVNVVMSCFVILDVVILLCSFEMMNKKLIYFLILGCFLKWSVNGLVTETVRG